jgi:hypothetical protein
VIVLARHTTMIIALVLAACTDPVPRSSIDGGTADAFAFDAVTSSDGATVDAIVTDAVSMDASSADASFDAGPRPDVTWGSCMAGTIAGTCVATSDCATVMHTAVNGLCPGPASSECCIPSTSPIACDPRAMVQPNTGLTEAAGTNGCPSGMVQVNATLCVDQYEASLVQVNADGSTSEWSPYFSPPSGTRVRALSRAGAVPQAYVSEIIASAACTDAGKRLCTDTEWLAACQGSMGYTYPYGNTRMPGVCNDHRAMHPAIELYGSSESWIYSHLDDACINQLPMSVALTGAFAGCVSESGAHDMMGNVHEWTSDPNGTFRGGYYMDTSLNGNGCLYATTAHAASYPGDYSTGFRCCATHP